MIVKCLLFVFGVTSSISDASILSSDELKAYENRRFISLEHLLISDRKSHLRASMHRQEKDLAGCRQIHRGKGGLAAALMCRSFLDREEKLGVRERQSDALVKDINLLCEKLAAEPNSLNKLLKVDFREGSSKKWGPCITETWRQVYLTAYANFDADPVAILALVRRAHGALPAGSPWEKRLSNFLHGP